MSEPANKCRWREEEDTVLKEYAHRFGPHNWGQVNSLMPTPLKRTAKSCRLRWQNHLRPEIKVVALTEHEKERIEQLQAEYGNQWALIAAKLGGRSDNVVKNWWNSKHRKHSRGERAAAGGRTGPAAPQPGGGSGLICEGGGSPGPPCILPSKEDGKGMEAIRRGSHTVLMRRQLLTRAMDSPRSAIRHGSSSGLLDSSTSSGREDGPGAMEELHKDKEEEEEVEQRCGKGREEDSSAAACGAAHVGSRRTARKRARTWGACGGCHLADSHAVAAIRAPEPGAGQPWDDARFKAGACLLTALECGSEDLRWKKGTIDGGSSASATGCPAATNVREEMPWPGHTYAGPCSPEVAEMSGLAAEREQYADVQELLRLLEEDVPAGAAAALKGARTSRPLSEFESAVIKAAGWQLPHTGGGALDWSNMAGVALPFPGVLSLAPLDDVPSPVGCMPGSSFSVSVTLPLPDAAALPREWVLPAAAAAACEGPREPGPATVHQLSGPEHTAPATCHLPQAPDGFDWPALAASVAALQHSPASPALSFVLPELDPGCLPHSDTSDLLDTTPLEQEWVLPAGASAVGGSVWEEPGLSALCHLSGPEHVAPATCQLPQAAAESDWPAVIESAAGPLYSAPSHDPVLSDSSVESMDDLDLPDLPGISDVALLDVLHLFGDGTSDELQFV